MHVRHTHFRLELSSLQQRPIKPLSSVIDTGGCTQRCNADLACCGQSNGSATEAGGDLQLYLFNW